MKGTQIPELKIPQNIDSILVDQSKKLFELDETAYRVLSYIAKHGRSTSYDIRSKSKVSAGSVYRRLNGEGQLPSLIDQEFVYVWKAEKFEKTKKLKKTYAVTLKGLLACLYKNKLEEIKAVHQLFDYISAQGGKCLIPPLTNLKKFEAALFIQYHLENGIKTTWIRSDRYFQQFRNHLSGFEEERLFADRYSDLLRAIRVGAGKWSLTVSQLFDELDLGSNNLKHNVIWNAIFDWPRSLIKIQNASNLQYLARMFATWSATQFNYAKFEDEWKLASAEAVEFLSSTRRNAA